jgi:hypothetical protein
MCERCDEIAVKIARYRRLSNVIDDRKMREDLLSLIADLVSEKGALYYIQSPKSKQKKSRQRRPRDSRRGCRARASSGLIESGDTALPATARVYCH